MRPHERGDEHLVLDTELSQLRRLELPLDGDAAVDEADPLDHERLPVCQIRQLLPVHAWLPSLSNLLVVHFYIEFLKSSTQES